MRKSTIAISILAVALGCMATRVSAQTLAFPEAEGFGRFSQGGRGGAVYEVTNLNDSGPGSLRAGVEASGKRVIIFRTGGEIALNSTLRITNPYITIAGQTAPGGGITLRNAAGNTSDPVQIRTSHVIIRYLRVRPGSINNTDASGKGTHGLTVGPQSHDVIIDHVSVSWGTDEMVSAYGNSGANDGPYNVTFQWMIISEGLLHPGGCGDCSKGFIPKRSHDVTLHHTLFAHNSQRNPKASAEGLLDVINNVTYNPGYSAAMQDSPDGVIPSRANYIGNFYKTGPNSSKAFFVEVQSTPSSFYVEGNITPGRPSLNGDELTGVVRSEDHKYAVATRFQPSAPVRTSSAVEAYARVLAEAGCAFPRRDAVDERIVRDVTNGTGKLISDPAEVGGWPVLAAGTPPPDADRDGLPDDWESQNGTDPRDPSGANGANGDVNGDGYDNIENYFNALPGRAGPPVTTPTPPPPPFLLE